MVVFYLCSTDQKKQFQPRPRELNNKEYILVYYIEMELQN